jgi:iron complex transport system ATP-binding protein
MAAVMMELTNISVRYGNKIVVNNISAKAETGQLIALVGPNGSGKSSLLKAIVGIQPHGGTTTLPAHPKERAKQLAYLAQNSTAPASRRVEEIIALGRTPFTGPFAKLSENDKASIRKAAKACDTETLFDREFSALSGGEQMRVHLSRALATKAQILLADEPITGLDPYYQLSILNILKDTATAGATIIVALHDLKLAQRFADRIWVIDDGQLVVDEPAATALTDHILKDVFRITADGNIAP